MSNIEEEVLVFSGKFPLPPEFNASTNSDDETISWAEDYDAKFAWHLQFPKSHFSPALRQALIRLSVTD